MKIILQYPLNDMKSLKVTCISDTHNQLHDIPLPGGDLLLHAGDATMVGNKKELKKFIEAFAAAPYKHKVWIAGNHDWGMEYDQTAYESWCGRRMRETRVLSETRSYILELCEHYNITYLNNSGVEIEGLKVWGSPDQPAFCGWAFNRSYAFLEEHWKTIPDDTNILITHAPAYGILDTLENGDMVGDVPLMKRINTLPNLKLHLCGHIHPSHGMIQIGETTHVNASILNDNYRIANKPITLEL